MQSIKMLTTAAGPVYSFQAGTIYHGVDDDLARQLIAGGAAEPAKDPRRAADTEIAAAPAPETAQGKGGRVAGKGAKPPASPAGGEAQEAGA